MNITPVADKRGAAPETRSGDASLGWELSKDDKEEWSVTIMHLLLLLCSFVLGKGIQFLRFLAALAALYLPLVTHRPFSIWTQRVAFGTWNTSDIWSEWCPDNKRQKDKKTKRQKDKKMNRWVDKKTKRQQYKKRVSYCDVREVSHSCDVFMWDSSSDVLKLCVVSCDKVVTATRRPLHLREVCWALLGKTLYLFQRICQPPSGFEMEFLPSLPQPFWHISTKNLAFWVRSSQI